MDENNQDELVESQVDVTETVTEKSLPESQVNKIVQKAKFAAEQKARKEVEEQYKQEMDELRQAKSSGNVSNIDIEAIAQQVQEKHNQQMMQAEHERAMQEVADKYFSTVDQAKQKFTDYEAIMSDFDAQEFPELLVLLANVENAPDVLYELGKNSSKLADIDYWAKRSPKMAQKELLKLSKSISENQTALVDANNSSVSPPLDRLQSSNISSGNGAKSISDLRKADWLRA